LAEELAADLYQLVITCNSEGKLANRVEESVKNLKLILPESTHDQGFAMTGSFTGMVLSSLEVFKQAADYEVNFQPIIKTGRQILTSLVPELKQAVNQEFSRVVFLGSAPLQGLIKEAALKVLELTNGQLVTDAYTFLGFRHGPKSQVNDETLIISYLSTEEYARQYELDLIKELALDQGEHSLITISNQLVAQAEKYSDYYWQLDMKDEELPADNYLLFNYILSAQLMAFFKSMSLGLSPDDPAPSGEVNRVVKGVKIYPYTERN
jgi:tagatose-6-phosphate ketose/aldose isomerase